MCKEANVKHSHSTKDQLIRDDGFINLFKLNIKQISLSTLYLLQCNIDNPNLQNLHDGDELPYRRLLDPEANNKDRLANMRRLFWVPSDWGTVTDEMKRVNKLFEDAGFEPHKINKCLKAGMMYFCDVIWFSEHDSTSKG